MNFIDLCFVTLELYTLNDKAFLSWPEPFFTRLAQIWARSSSNQTHNPKPKAIRFQIQQSKLVA